MDENETGNIVIVSTPEPQDTPPPVQAHSPTVYLCSSPPDSSSCSVLAPCDDDFWPHMEPNSPTDVLPADISEYALQLWADSDQQPMDVDQTHFADQTQFTNQTSTIDQSSSTDQLSSFDYQLSSMDVDQLPLVNHQHSLVDQSSANQQYQQTQTPVNTDLRDTTNMEVDGFDIGR